MSKPHSRLEQPMAMQRGATAGRSSPATRPTLHLLPCLHLDLLEWSILLQLVPDVHVLPEVKIRKAQSNVVHGGPCGLTQQQRVVERKCLQVRQVVDRDIRDAIRI